MKFILQFGAMLLLAILTFSSCQQSSSSEGDSSASNELKIDYEKFQLDNGLDIILHQDKSDPIVSVAIMYHVGSNREKPGRTGFAHFFEHMLFQNSENVPKGGFFKTIEELGGDFNGGTWSDGTVYYEIIPKDALERILWMESDRMGFLINTVTTPVLENEKEVVKNEKRQRVDNQPYGHTRYVIGKALYPEGHPYNWQTIGSLEDLQAATIDDVKEFYDKWYGPNNATMVIAGDFDTDEVKGWLEKYFAEIPAKPEVETMKPMPSQLTENIFLMHEDNFAQLPELRLVFPTVEQGHADSYPLRYLGQLLSDGKRAPLYKEIVEKQKLAPSTSTGNRSQEVAGTFTFRVRANEGVDLDSVHAAIFTALENFEKNGIDEKDMARIKNIQEKDFYSGIASLLGKSFQLASFNEFAGSPEALTEEIQKILGVTKEDVMRVYEKYIKGKNYLATSFVPITKAELAVEGSDVAEVVEEPVVQGAEQAPLEETEGDYEKTPSKIDRTVVPELGEAPLVTVPKIWTSELKNGMKVYGIQNSELPLVEFSIRIKGGMLLDNPEKIGIANLITDVMQEGTANKTPEELEDAIGGLGAEINMITASEFITITGSCLARNYEATLALVEEMLLEPRWDEAEFERLKKSTLTQIQQRAGQPNTIATSVFIKLMYKGSMLANSTLGTTESVSAITLDDLKNYYQQHFSPSVASFHVVGAIDEGRVKKSLGSLSEKWTSKSVSVPVVEAPAATEEPVLYFVDIPNSKQSVIQIGKPMDTNSDEELYAAQFVNERLGSGTNARLFQQLREEKGYTYGAYSGIPQRISETFFRASSSVRANVTPESAALFKEILEGYKEDYNEEDLEITKTTLIKQNALAFETLNDKMGILQNISTYNLPMDYVKEREKVVNGMTLDKAKEAIGNYINPNKMIYLVVGDAATQADRLKEVGLGEPILLDKEGEEVEKVAN